MNDPYGEAGPREQPPASDEQRPRPAISLRQAVSKPYVTYTILAVTILVYILQELSTGLLREPLLQVVGLVFGPGAIAQLRQASFEVDLMVLLGGKINDFIIAGQYWRLLTPALLHAGIYHIGFNMYALYAFGPSLESFYGHKRFLLLYVLGAFGGNALSFLLTEGRSVGASTAIFGLIGAEAVFIYLNRRLFGARARPMLTNVVLMAGINLALGLMPGIDDWGHLVGLIAGVAFAWFAGPRLDVEGIYPTYSLVDRRSQASAWIAGVAIAALFVAVVVLGIMKYTA